MSDQHIHTWDPFQSPLIGPLGQQLLGQAEQQVELAKLAQATFSTPAGAAFLAQLRQEVEAPPSYLPGMTFDQVAFAEGKKALLRRIDHLIEHKGA